MPFSWNGSGTRYYGKRDREPNGSYITTEWVTIIYIPIFPIRSLKIRPTGEQLNVVLIRSQQYRVQKVPLNKPQVRNTYAVSGTIIALFLAVMSAIYISEYPSEPYRSDPRSTDSPPSLTPVEY